MPDLATVTALLDSPLVLALVALAALAVAIMATIRPLIGASVFVVAIFADVVPPLVPGLTLVKIAGLALLLGWCLRAAVRPGTQEDLIPTAPILAASLGVLGAYLTLSLLWASDPGAASGSLVRWLFNLALVPIFFATLARARDLRVIMWVFAATAVASALGGGLYAVITGISEEGRIFSGAGDPNYTAASLVAAIPMALALAWTGRGWSRAMALVIAAGTVPALILTGSRGGLVAAFLVAVLLIPFAPREYRWRVSGGVAVALVLVIALVAILPQAGTTRERLGEVAQSQSGSEASTGRAELWAAAGMMLRDAPLTGVGTGNFPVRSRDYVFQMTHVERSDLILDDPKVVHNAYLGALAETGVVGLLLFLLVLAAAAACVVQAVRARPPPSVGIMARALGASLTAMVIANVFVSGEYMQSLWVIIALCAAALRIARAPRTTDTAV